MAVLEGLAASKLLFTFIGLTKRLLDKKVVTWVNVEVFYRIS
jgi:hypothetical protein